MSNSLKVIGNITVQTDLADVNEDELLLCGVSRRGRHGVYSSYSKSHICRVDHRYGPSREHVFVVPLCGVERGRAQQAFPFDDEICKRCIAKAEES